MTITDQFLIAQQAYQEILEELHPGSSVFAPEVAPSEFSSDKKTIGPLPEGFLSLGVAADGFPVLLNLHNPLAGPLLIAGDGGSGKTDLLKSLALSSEPVLIPGDVQFGVLTNFTEEWRDIESLPGSLGIWPAFHQSAGDFLSRLIHWTDALQDSRQFVLLLVDDLDTMTDLSLVCRHSLRWLLEFGPERHVWPIVSMHSRQLNQNKGWLDFFQTAIYGYTDLEELVPGLAIDELVSLNGLTPGVDFSVKLADGWMTFSIPHE